MPFVYVLCLFSGHGANMPLKAIVKGGEGCVGCADHS